MRSRSWAIGLGFSLSFLIVLGAFPSLLQAAWVPPAGFTRTPESFTGGAFAVAPDGKVAIGLANASGGATIKVYANAAAAQANSSPLRTFSDPTYKFWGDLTFTDSNTLLFSENGDEDTVYQGIVSTGASAALAPVGSVPAPQGVIQHGSTVYAVAAVGPGANALYSINAGVASVVLSNLGTGYLGGIAIDSSGNFLLTDTNDPTFAGNAGKLLRYTSSFTPLTPIDLASGNGSDAYDVALDSEGDAFVTTGATLTRIPFGSTTAQQFGSGFGSFAFITNLDYTGSGFEPNAGAGKLFINAGFGDDGAMIGVTPIPEPTCIAMVVVACIVLVGFRVSGIGFRVKNSVSLPLTRTPNPEPRYPIACLLLASLLSMLLTQQPTRAADHFYASKVISIQPGAQQQKGFTDPTLALGPPRGGGTDSASTDVYNLGNGGYLTLGFDTATSAGHIFNGPGDDFIVSENPFYRDGDPHASFAELMWVYVSTDGVYWSRFEPTSKTPGPVSAFGTIDPDDVTGFAGVHPVLANVDENSIDPFDPTQAGGDAFDLSDLTQTAGVTSGKVDLSNIRYIRLADVIGDGSRFDYVGRAIFDPTGPGSGGADVDAVAVINGVHLPEPFALSPLTGLAFILRRSK